MKTKRRIRHSLPDTRHDYEPQMPRIFGTGKKEMNKMGGVPMRNYRKLKPMKRIQEEFLKLDREREEKIYLLKKSYELNEYDVEGKKIAGKIINESLEPPTPRI